MGKSTDELLLMDPCTDTAGSSSVRHSVFVRICRRHYILLLWVVVCHTRVASNQSDAQGTKDDATTFISDFYGTRVVMTLTYWEEQENRPAVMLCGPEELRRRAKMRLCTQVCAKSVLSPCKTKPSWSNLPLSIPPTRHKRKYLTTAGSSWLVSPANAHKPQQS